MGRLAVGEKERTGEPAARPPRMPVDAGRSARGNDEMGPPELHNRFSRV